MHDLDALLTRLDLAVLADVLLGPRRGRGPAASWRCPHPSHGEQTGATPPVTVFVGRTGLQRYHCHACGQGGTAIDLVMITRRSGTRDAIEWLAAWTGTSPPIAPFTRPALRPPPLVRPSAELETYVRACEAVLWDPSGRPVRTWLAGRGLAEAVLRANRVGADPGPRRLRRASGLPHGGIGAVFPVVDAQRRAVFLQLRYLDPGRVGRRYDNPRATLAPNPRVALVRTPQPRRDVLVVCEGIPDALSAAGAGLRAAAVLGAGLSDARLAVAVTRAARGAPIVVAFDADERGRGGAVRLTGLIADVGAQARTLDVPGEFGDLNGWLTRRGVAFASDLDAAIARRLARVPNVRRAARGVTRALGR